MLGHFLGHDFFSHLKVVHDFLGWTVACTRMFFTFGSIVCLAEFDFGNCPNLPPTPARLSAQGSN